MSEEKKDTLEERLIEALKERQEKVENRKIEDIDSYIKSLQKRTNLFLQEHDLKKRDVVIWKEGLKNKVRPAYGEPCTVLDILHNPIFDNDKNSGSPYFNEPLDLVLGIIDEENDFLILHCDKRRFQPYKKNDN